MRWGRISIIAFVIIIIVVGGGYCLNNVKFGGTGKASQDNPEVVAKAAIEAISSKDAEKVAVYFTPIPAQTMRNRLNSMYSKYDTIEIDGVAVDTILSEGASVRVQALYNIVISINGMYDTQHRNIVVKLVKIEGKWYINEAF